ncbi:MAG: hypothetical protein IJZ70_00210 [Bacteroidales bacterium]|nr:hypothetical protein [Bacteroidales bacterium]
MKKLVYLILAAAFISCTNNIGKDDPLYDFGVVEYEEPFCGLLKKQPSILRKSLNLPPYSWLAPDTLSLEKTFIVDFNEDAIRSNATATLFFTDSLNSTINSVKFYTHDRHIKNDKLTIVADSLTKVVTIGCRIDPQVGEKEITGNLFVTCENIDQINSISIQQDIVKLADWRVEQKISIPWLLWLLWALTALIIIIIGVVILISLFYALQYTTPIVIQLFSAVDYSLGTPLSVTDGGKGNWTGVRGNSTYEFDLNQKPKTSNYGNMKDQTFGELGNDLGDPKPQVRFRKGYPRFDRDPATKTHKPLEVSFKDGIGKYLKKKTNGSIDRQYLHEVAFNKLAEKYNISLDEIKVFKGDSAPVAKLAEQWGCTETEVWKKCNNPHKIQRVLHEVEDGVRVQLVPRIYHDNVTHVGGVEKVSKYLFD